MSKFAWVENGKIRDVAHAAPDHIYAPSVAANYNTVVPDDAANGDGWDGSKLTKPAPVQAPAPVVPAKKLSRVQFKLLFTLPELVNVRDAIEGGDKILREAMLILEDPSLEEVDLGLNATKAAVGYLAEKKYITAERAAAILKGEEPA